MRSFITCIFYKYHPTNTWIDLALDEIFLWFGYVYLREGLINQKKIEGKKI